MKRFILMSLCLCACAVFAQSKASELQSILSNENRITGSMIKPSELSGRVILLWNVNSPVNSFMSAIEQHEENPNNNSSWKPKVTEYNGYRQVENDVDALKRVLKTALSDGRVLVVAITKVPEVASERRRYTRAIRRLNSLPYPVYNSDLGSCVFDCQGNKALSFNGIDGLKGNKEFIKIMKETPPYIPGRILNFRTPLHENEGKALIEGRNITALYQKLKKEAADTASERGQEAAKMISALDAFIASRKAEIETALSATPSLASAKIDLFKKTCPGLAKPYLMKQKAILKSPEVNKLSGARRFLEEVNSGKYGESDIIKYANVQLRTMKPLLTSKNASVAAEAASIKAILEGLAEENDDSF